MADQFLVCSRLGLYIGCRAKHTHGLRVMYVAALECVRVVVSGVNTGLESRNIELCDGDVKIAHSKRIPRQLAFAVIEVREMGGDHPVHIPS